MGYSIVDFAKSLEIGRCKIRNTPNLIFLCGGKTAESGPYKSARDYFHRHLKAKAASIAGRVKLAEDVNAKFHGEFPDLLELENYLADLADITVLFVESPGSIAELGAFAQSDVLRPKTLAVLNTAHSSDRSFILEGPVLKAQNENPQLVHYYEWDPKHLNSAHSKEGLGEMAEELAKFLKARDAALPKQQTFDAKKRGHILLIVADLIAVAGIATMTDITACLGEVGCDPAQQEPSEVKRYLSLLENASFIKRERRSNQAFYVAAQSARFLKYSYRPGAALTDQKRIRSEIRDSLEPLRKSVLKSFLRKRRIAP